MLLYERLGSLCAQSVDFYRVFLYLCDLHLGLCLLPQAGLGLVGLETKASLWWHRQAVGQPLHGEVLQKKTELTPECVAVKELLLPSLRHGDGLGALALAAAGGQND